MATAATSKTASKTPVKAPAKGGAPNVKPIPPAPSRQVSKARSFFSFVLFAIALVLILSLNLSYWLSRTVLNTDQFVATTTPLIKEPAVQTQVSKVFADKIVQTMGKEQAVQQLGGVIPGLTVDNVNVKVAETAKGVLASASFQNAWVTTIRTAHTSFTGILKTTDQNPTVDVKSIFTNIQAGLKGTSLEKVADVQLPAEAGTITIKNPQAVSQARRSVKDSQTGLIVMAVIIVLLILCGTLLAGHHLRALGIFLIFVAVAMFVAVLMATFVGEAIVKQAHNDSVALADSIWVVLRKPLLKQSETVAVVSLVAGVVLVGVSMFRRKA